MQLHRAAESCTICSSRSRRVLRKLLDTASYIHKGAQHREMRTWVHASSGIRTHHSSIPDLRLSLNCDRLTNQPTNQPTPRRGVLENLRVAMPVKKFAVVYETRRFVAMVHKSQ